jgi:hypothetical protein
MKFYILAPTRELAHHVLHEAERQYLVSRWQLPTSALSLGEVKPSETVKQNEFVWLNDIEAGLGADFRFVIEAVPGRPPQLTAQQRETYGWVKEWSRSHWREHNAVWIQIYCA